MGLAVLAQAIAERFDAPVLGIGHGAAHLLNDGLELLRKLIDLRRRHVLTRKVHMLIKRHECAFLFESCRSRRQATRAFRKARTLEMREHGTPGSKALPRGRAQPSVQLPAGIERKRGL